MTDSDDEQLSKLVSLTSSALEARAKEALAVLVYNGIHIFVNSIDIDDGKIGFEYTTFPVVESDSIQEVEMFIKDQILCTSTP